GYSVCISSQAGCKMGCKFCASAGIPFSRSLSAGEILGQVIAVSRHENVRISHIVIMGIGEPLDNYDNVVKFLRRVTAEEGLSGVVAEGGVIVADYLILLGVALARVKNYSACVLQHRNKIGKYVALGVKVLYGRVVDGPLPFPAAGLGLVVAAVAVPYCNVAAVHTLLEFRTELPAYKRYSRLAVDAVFCFVAFTVVTEFRGDKFFQVEAFPEYLSKGVILILLREKVFELFSEPLNVALVPWLVCQVVVKVKVQSLTSCDDVL
ncbi:MAG: radical SAM protein, partial [Bacteroidales bacterium]|nr:radical SAM protein [Bacteroidales bacterium]